MDAFFQPGVGSGPRIGPGGLRFGDRARVPRRNVTDDFQLIVGALHVDVVHGSGGCESGGPPGCVHEVGKGRKIGQCARSVVAELNQNDEIIDGARCVQRCKTPAVLERSLQQVVTEWCVRKWLTCSSEGTAAQQLPTFSNLFLASLKRPRDRRARCINSTAALGSKLVAPPLDGGCRCRSALRTLTPTHEEAATNNIRSGMAIVSMSHGV